MQIPGWVVPISLPFQSSGPTDQLNIHVRKIGTNQPQLLMFTADRNTQLQWTRNKALIYMDLIVKFNEVNEVGISFCYVGN